MNPPGRYTFKVFYERLGTNRKDWMQKTFTVNTTVPQSDDALKRFAERQAARWRGTIEGSNPKFSDMYGDIKRITMISRD